MQGVKSFNDFLNNSNKDVLNSHSKKIYEISDVIYDNRPRDFIAFKNKFNA